MTGVVEMDGTVVVGPLNPRSFGFSTSKVRKLGWSLPMGERVSCPTNLWMIHDPSGTRSST